MSNIRVNPEELQQATQELAAAADRLRELGGELSKSGLSAPSYDGQFGPQVRALGAEGEAALMAQSQRLSELSEQLAAKAEEFIQADEQSLSGLAALGAKIHNWLQSLGLSAADSLSPDVTGTPMPTIQAVAIPTPEATGTPVPRPLSDYQRQLALNARYGFCVYPLTDPDAIQNYVANGGMVFGKGPFQSLPGPAPGNAFDGLSTNRWLVAMRGLGLLAQAWRRGANLDAVESMEPNVDVSLHYAMYEDGLRVSGVRVENNYDIPIKVFAPLVYEGLELPDGSLLFTNFHPVQVLQYVAPGSTEFIQFEGLPETPISKYMTVQVNIVGASVEYQSQYRRIGWRINAESGVAEQIEPGWSEFH